jgi:two-component system, cell cycle response regulator
MADDSKPSDGDDLLETGEFPAMPLDPHATTERPPDPVSWFADAGSFERTTERSITVPKDPKRDRATLTVLSGFNAGQVFALDQPVHLLGRGTDADVWAEDPALSRHHAKISRGDDGRFSLEDTGSANGTFVGARRVEKIELDNGDRIQLGPNLILRFAVLDDREEELQRRLYESSTRDPLTRAYNRKYFFERIDAELAHTRRHGGPMSVLMIDLDEFKKTNDTYGHLAGDMVIRVVAAQLSRFLRVEDVLARFGGEEFVVLARSATHADAMRLAERMRAGVEEVEIPAASGVKLRATASFGVATLAELPPDAVAMDLVRRADERLMKAKAAGRNRVVAEG